MGLLSLLNTNELVAQIICFLILLAIMRKFLWKRFLGILDKRKETISSELKVAEDAKDTAMKLKHDYEIRLSEIEAERQVKIRQAADEARKVADGIIAKAEADGEKLLEKARFSLKDEIARAREVLKNDVVDIAIRAAEKVIEERLSEESDKRIVEDFIEEIGKK